MKKEAEQEHCERMIYRDGEFTEDRISQLPQYLIHDILMLVPLKDAAKTALVSKQWRRHWRTIPQLVFDDEDFEPVTESSAASKLILNVYESLLLHDGPVTIFVLAVPGLTPCGDEIDYIVDHVSGRGVQEFTLEFEFSRESSHGGANYYRLPSSMFTALHLKYLELKGCLLMVPPWFVRFSELTGLALTEVSLPSDFFEQFLPKCPHLEWLSLSDWEGPTELEIDAPRLCFKHAPLLTQLILFVYGLHKLDYVALFASLPLLQEMFIGSQVLTVLAEECHVPSKLPTLLGSLQILQVCDHAFGGLEDPVLVCLIMSSPNLHTFKLRDSKIDKPAVTSVGSLLEAERCRGDGLCLQHLKVVELENSIGEALELELVKFILANAPQLLRVMIKPSTRLCSKKVIKFMDEVLEYKRVSEAEVIYDWKDNDEED